jgi:acetyltransferase-like isoleucine patch superfamily enzyme
MKNAMEFCRIAENVVLGENVSIHGFVNLYGCSIGDETRIGAFVEVQKNATIGARCKISSHTFICEGVTIEDEVFIGHNVTFINDRYPRATTQDNIPQDDKDWSVIPTIVRKGASIGSSVTILCGITIGAGAIIGAGSVVLTDIPTGQIWAGNPAKFIKNTNKT